MIQASTIIDAWARAAQFLSRIQRSIPKGAGLDITGFGLDDFNRWGLVALVLVNCKEYCSKWLVLATNQFIPNHCHPKKKETISCEEGVLEIILYGTDDGSGEFDQRQLTADVEVNNRAISVDCSLPDGSTMLLPAGTSITLPPGVWHEFGAIGGNALAVEVSTSNNDKDDNTFQNKEIGRFATTIEQDVPGVVVTIDDEGFVYFPTAANAA